MSLHPDFKDLLSAFDDADVQYLLVGGYAVAFHSRPRFTKDIDLWIAGSRENVEKVHAALARFGAPTEVLDELGRLGPEDILYLGHPPVRVDIFKQIPGVEFEAAYRRRVESEWDGVRVKVIALDDLIAAKRASAREQDRLDVGELERTRQRRS